jgi:hypothetical protein
MATVASSSKTALSVFWRKTSSKRGRELELAATL